MDRRKQIEKQIALKQKQKEGNPTQLEDRSPFPRTEDKEPTSSRFHKLALQSILSGCLFFAIGIAYDANHKQAESVQAFVNHSFEEHFQFAAVSSYFESVFGSPLELLPDQRAQEGSDDIVNYALPASGSIKESFSEDRKGILLETGVEEVVKAVKGGHVINLYEDEESLGQVVELQHQDGTVSVYGMLDDVHVRPYDILSRGAAIGTILETDEEQAGLFYFALKENGEYIDPSTVMNFD
ncbi:MULTISPECIES: peptidoglycan DD-metalloendopeptidase family protein [Bacillaceae]|uniref:M23 family metallopeptidase n=1 Tax=Shouchella lehensis TaxID=300825 RepID=A0A4Y7WQV7_9BACI|nr:MULTISPECIES: peptidoglycan DD-metalloendopeptidase family protein [Bacillaceae]TES51005.1 M23 family metallopeptidase [Shouchella lehensis]